MHLLYEISVISFPWNYFIIIRKIQYSIEKKTSKAKNHSQQKKLILFYFVNFECRDQQTQKSMQKMHLIEFNFKYAIFIQNFSDFYFLLRFNSLIIIQNYCIKYLKEVKTQNMRQLPPLKTNLKKQEPKPFDFLKKGKDQQFQNAMKSIENMYDDMFGDDERYDKMFQTFKTQNNPITASIDEMSNQIFELDKPKEQKYVKMQNNLNQNTNYNHGHQQDQQQSVIIGQPVFLNSNPYQNQPYFQNNPYKNK